RGGAHGAIGEGSRCLVMVRARRAPERPADIVVRTRLGHSCRVREPSACTRRSSSTGSWWERRGREQGSGRSFLRDPGRRRSAAADDPGDAFVELVVIAPLLLLLLAVVVVMVQVLDAGVGGLSSVPRP